MCFAFGYLFNKRHIWQGLGLSGASQRGAAFVPRIVFCWIIFRFFGSPHLRAAFLRAFAIEPCLKLEERKAPRPIFETVTANFSECRFP